MESSFRDAIRSGRSVLHNGRREPFGPDYGSRPVRKYMQMSAPEGPARVGNISAPAAPVFVLSLFDTGLATLRLLSRCGVWVEGFDHEPQSVGFATRAAPTHLVSLAGEASDGLMRQIVARVGKLNRGRAILIPASDEYVDWLCRHKEALEEYATWLLPPIPALKLILKKDSQVKLAEGAGLRVPRTVTLPPALDAGAFRALARDFEGCCSYPMCVKPLCGAAWKQVFGTKGMLIHSAEELWRLYEQVRALGIDILVQEVIPGPVTCNFEVSYYVSMKGVLESLFVMQKIRQLPPGLGTASYGITEVNSARVAQLKVLVQRWIQASQYRGIGNTEFKWDPRCNEFVYIETNPRVWQQIDLAAKAGQNFPWMLYAELTGCALRSKNKVCQNVLAWSDPLRDAEAVLRRERSWLGRLKGLLWTWPRAIAQARSHGVFALQDLGPGLKTVHYGASLPRLAAGLLRKVFSLNSN